MAAPFDAYFCPWKIFFQASIPRDLNDLIVSFASIHGVEYIKAGFAEG